MLYIHRGVWTHAVGYIEEKIISHQNTEQAYAAELSMKGGETKANKGLTKQYITSAELPFLVKEKKRKGTHEMYMP